MIRRTKTGLLGLVAVLFALLVGCGDGQMETVEVVEETFVEAEAVEAEAVEQPLELAVIGELQYAGIDESLQLAAAEPAVSSGDPATPALFEASALRSVTLDKYLLNPAIFSRGLIYVNDSQDQFQIVVSGAEEERVDAYIDEALLALDWDAQYFQPQYLPVEPIMPLDELLINEVMAQSGASAEEIRVTYDSLVEESGEENVSLATVAEVMGVDMAAVAAAVQDQAVNLYLSGSEASDGLQEAVEDPGLNFIAQPSRPGDFLLLEVIQEASGLTVEELNMAREELVESEGEENVNFVTLANALDLDHEELIAAADDQSLGFANREASFKVAEFSTATVFSLEPATPLEMYTLSAAVNASDLTVAELDSEVAGETGLTVDEAGGEIGLQAGVLAGNALDFSFALPTNDVRIEDSLANLINSPGLSLVGSGLDRAYFADFEYAEHLIANPSDLVITFEWLNQPEEAPEEPLAAWFDVDPSIDDGVTHYYRARCQVAAVATLATSTGEASLRMWRNVTSGVPYLSIGTAIALAGLQETLSHSSSPNIVQYDINVRGGQDGSRYRIFGFWTRGFGEDCD